MTATSFYYFGFGSNMLTKRIHIQNPTAVRVSLGRLDNYRLDFHTGSKLWYGAPATIVPTKGSHVYGSIWQIEMRNMKDLDKQEGVQEGIYVPMEVLVVCQKTHELVNCRAYRLRNQPPSELQYLPWDNVPLNRQPSLSYLKTLIKGAQETGVPAAYIEFLRSIRHNGAQVDALEEDLDLLSVKV